MTNKRHGMSLVDYKPFELPKHSLDCVLCGKTIAYTDDEPTEKLKESFLCIKCCLNEVKFDAMALSEIQKVKSVNGSES